MVTNDSPIIWEPAPDVLLQTQQVSLAEVRQDLGAWKDAIAEELTALITIHQAVRLITKTELQELEASGVRVQEYFPSRLRIGVNERAWWLVGTIFLMPNPRIQAS